MSRSGALRRTIRRASCLGALPVAAALWAAPARAGEPPSSVDACISAYEAGQRLRQRGDLVAAAEELLTCGGPACPVRMQADCQRWRDDVERALPAIVFRVRDAGGRPLTDVYVSIDGAAARRLDGRALPMNPGEHELVFERHGYRSLHTPIFVTEGEKLEPRLVTLAPSEGSAAPAPVAHADLLGESEPIPGVRPLPLWPVTFGALGAAGAVGFAFFGVRAQTREADLERCTPHCPVASVEDVKQDFLLANVSLGVGLAGLIAAGLWLILDEPRPATGGAPHSGLQLGTTPSWVMRF